MKSSIARFLLINIFYALSCIIFLLSSDVVVLAEASGAGETAASIAAGVSEALAASTSLLIELLFSSTSNVRIYWEKRGYGGGNPQ